MLVRRGWLTGVGGAAILHQSDAFSVLVVSLQLSSASGDADGEDGEVTAAAASYAHSTDVLRSYHTFLRILAAQNDTYLQDTYA